MPHCDDVAQLKKTKKHQEGKHAHIQQTTN